MRGSFSPLFAGLVLIAACNGNKVGPEENVAVEDTVMTDSVNVELEGDSTEVTPVAVDGLFDDFVYSFMHNRKFQMQRIVFPLPNVVDGKDRPIGREQWKFDQLYAHQDVYTMLFDSEKTLFQEKDSTVHRVTVEWVYLTTGRVKQYQFNKENGIWRLTGLDTHALDNNINRDFFTFYRDFSSNTDFQIAHIENPFSFKTYDSDTFQEIEGVLDVAQWRDFAPEMPSGVITNINYGQRYAANGRRVLVITSPSAGMSCSLSFEKKKGKEWMLVGMETI